LPNGRTILSAISATIDCSSVNAVADRHRLAAYPNKHCWRAFRGYQHRLRWTTLKYKNSGFFGEFFAISGCDAYFKSESSRNYFKTMLSRVSSAVAQISYYCHYYCCC